jgi:hypothetical protein
MNQDTHIKRTIDKAAEAAALGLPAMADQYRDLASCLQTATYQGAAWRKLLAEVRRMDTALRYAKRKQNDQVEARRE